MHSEYSNQGLKGCERAHSETLSAEPDGRNSDSGRLLRWYAGEDDDFFFQKLKYYTWFERFRNEELEYHIYLAKFLTNQSDRRKTF